MGHDLGGCPDDTFDAIWKDRASQLAGGPTAAYQRVKQTLRKTYDNSLEKQLLLEAKLQGELGKSHDFREGVLAFLDKRPAHFEGR